MSDISDLIKVLGTRGLIESIANEAVLKARLDEGASAYLGIDPTADSLHVGHLLPLMLARRLAAGGVPVILLMGGATARIGDPSGRSTMRAASDAETTGRNAALVAAQAAALVPGAMLLDNMDWMGGFNLLRFLEQVGRHVPVNTLLSMSSMSKRLENGEGGLTFMEAAYPLMQAYDFAHLAHNFGVAAQIGGRDQWGNCTLGMDLWHRLSPSRPVLGGIFTPLLTNTAGEKMGKSAGGAVWLSSARTSHFDFHQFWRSMPDMEARTCMPLLLDASDQELEETLALQGKDFSTAKETLADQMTLMVRGDFGLAEARRMQAIVFGNASLADMPARKVCRPGGPRVVDAIHALGFSESLSAARRLVDGGAVEVDGNRISDGNMTLSDGLHVIGVGKRRIGKVDASQEADT